MRNKTMTIHEFMQEYRIKEFNRNKDNSKQVYFILIILVLLGFTATTGYLNTNECTTAFQQLNTLSLF